MTEYIYKLINPRTNLPFYIGRTNSPQRRYKEHTNIAYSNEPICSRYIEILIRNGLAPRIEIIDTCESVVDSIKMENKYIKDYWNKYTLLNQKLPTATHKWKYPSSKEESIALCGIGGRYCGYYNDCAFCKSRETDKRIAETERVIRSHDGQFFRAIIKTQQWECLRQKLNYRKIEYQKIPQDNGMELIVTSEAVLGMSIDFVRTHRDKLIEELTKEKNLYAPGRRSSTRKWKFSA